MFFFIQEILLCLYFVKIYNKFDIIILFTKVCIPEKYEKKDSISDLLWLIKVR